MAAEVPQGVANRVALGENAPNQNPRYFQRATMAEHEPGSMDITEQEKTFEGFIRWSIRISVASIAALLFLAIFNS